MNWLTEPADVTREQGSVSDVELSEEDIDAELHRKHRRRRIGFVPIPDVEVCECDDDEQRCTGRPDGYGLPVPRTPSLRSV